MIPKGLLRSGDRWVCRYCLGRGCLSCPPTPPAPEVAPEPEPQPLLRITYDELADHESEAFRLFRAAVGRDSVVKAFGPGGGGHAEVLSNLQREREAIFREREAARAARAAESATTDAESGEP